MIVKGAVDRLLERDRAGSGRKDGVREITEADKEKIQTSESGIFDGRVTGTGVYLS